MKPVLPLPLDIRLMQAGTQVLFVLAAILLLAALCAWLARHPVLETIANCLPIALLINFVCLIN